MKVHIWWEGVAWEIEDGDCLLDLLQKMTVKDLEDLKGLTDQVMDEKLKEDRL